MTARAVGTGGLADSHRIEVVRKLKTSDGKNLEELIKAYEQKQHFTELQLEVALKAHSIDAEKAYQLLEETKVIFDELHEALALITQLSNETNDHLGGQNLGLMADHASERDKTNESLRDFQSIQRIPGEIATLTEIMESSTWRTDAELLVETHRKMAALSKRTKDIDKQIAHHPEEAEVLGQYKTSITKLKDRFWDAFWIQWSTQFIELSRHEATHALFGAIIDVVEAEAAASRNPEIERRKLFAHIQYRLDDSLRGIQHRPKMVSMATHCCQILDDVVDAVRDVGLTVIPLVPVHYQFGPTYLRLVHTMIKVALVQADFASSDLPQMFAWIAEYNGRIRGTVADFKTTQKMLETSDLTESLAQHIDNYLSELKRSITNAASLAINSVSDQGIIDGADGQPLLGDGVRLFQTINTSLMNAASMSSGRLVKSFVAAVAAELTDVGQALRRITGRLGGKDDLRLLCAIGNSAAIFQGSTVDLRSTTKTLLTNLNDPGPAIEANLSSVSQLLHGVSIDAYEAAARAVVRHASQPLDVLWTGAWAAHAAQDGTPDPAGPICGVLEAIIPPAMAASHLMPGRAAKRLKSMILDALMVEMLRPFFKAGGKDRLASTNTAFVVQSNDDIAQIVMAFTTVPEIEVTERAAAAQTEFIRVTVSLLTVRDDSDAVTAMNFLRVAKDADKDVLHSLLSTRASLYQALLKDAAVVIPGRAVEAITPIGRAYRLERKPVTLQTAAIRPAPVSHGGLGSARATPRRQSSVETLLTPRTAPVQEAVRDEGRGLAVGMAADDDDDLPPVETFSFDDI